VTRYVTPLREGGSLPAIAEADDDFLYVIKFRGAGQGIKALIADLIGGEIARALGLKVPELVFANLDEAFGRRLQSIIHFPVPKPNERLKLWQSSFSTKTELAEDVNLELLSEKFELAGGSIINVVQYASLMALDRGENIIRKMDLWEGIRKEYIKEGKTI